MHYQHLQTEIANLKENKSINQITYLKFLKRLKQPKHIRSENPADHFCVFFLPIDLKAREIFLSHHVKADDWIPPGGHIEENEHPVETVKREMMEELQFKVTDEKIKLFDLTIKNINKPHRSCKRHYDFWYLIFMDKTNFVFDHREFYTASWLTKQQAANITKQKDFQKVIRKALKLI